MLGTRRDAHRHRHPDTARCPPPAQWTANMGIGWQWSAQCAREMDSAVLARRSLMVIPSYSPISPHLMISQH